MGGIRHSTVARADRPHVDFLSVAAVAHRHEHLRRHEGEGSRLRQFFGFTALMTSEKFDSTGERRASCPPELLLVAASLSERNTAGGSTRSIGLPPVACSF